MSVPPSRNITFDADILQNLDAALNREWLVTNRLGGYASSTLAAANTRRYHGLLVAALNPPVGRAVLLSKLEETMEIVAPDGSQSPSYLLSANLYPDSVWPQGYRHLEKWEAYPVPAWTYAPQPGVRLVKRVWMAAGHNTTYISYTLEAAPDNNRANLHLVPLLAWKDYHSEMHATHSLEFEWYSPSPQVARQPGDPEGVVRVTLPPISRVTSSPMTLSLYVSRTDGSPFPGATFDSQAYWYFHFQHPRERERGLDYDEDLYCLGMFTTSLAVGESVVIIATSETAAPEPPEDVRARREKEQARLLQEVGTDDIAIQQLALAAEQFLVRVPGGRSTIIAGYPWFSDWGRDTMIALPGLCLTTGHKDLAKEILLSFAAFVDQGMLPNRFPDAGSAPEYNTVDATLWYFVAIYRYIEATGDIALLKDTLWNVLEQIVHWHQQGTRYNIKVDADNLLFAGQPGVQLTWMDAKVGDWVVTPRIGKPVEINALWHNALKTMSHFARLLDDSETAQKYDTLALKTATIFAARFARPDGLGLFDVLDTPNSQAPDESIRPNQVFALSLPFPPLDPNSPLARAVIKVVQDELLTPLGLRTLSPHDSNYKARYEGDTWHRDGAYHQGTVWPWLLGPFAEGHYKVCKDREQALNFLRPLHHQMTTLVVGSLPEIYDGSEPQRPNGCIAQAWSISETLRVWKWLL